MRISDHVSTKIGTIGDMTETSCHGGGKTHPGAVYPFGMTAFGPDTLEGGDNGSGYSYHHTTIDGFSINHMSGVGWYGDLGNFQVMPTVGPLNLLSGTYRDALTVRSDRGYESDFRHETEVTGAGYYAVTLDTYGIRAETTASLHTGMIRMTYPAGKARRVQINLARRIAGRSPRQEVRLIGGRILEGCIHCPATHGGFGRGAGHVSYDLYFHAVFSEPWKDFGIWDKNAPVHGVTDAYDGEEVWFYADFAADGGPISLKVAVSYISIKGARNNYAAEAADVSFDGMREAAGTAWDEALSVIRVEDTREDPDLLTVFYTTLYHALLDPRVYSDADGSYLSADGTVRHAKDFVKRTVFSGWDVFRSEFPLLTIVRPDVVRDVIRSLIDIAEHENVSFPRWELLGHDTGCMLGDPGVIVTVDAYRKGIRDFDVQKAYGICLRTAFDPASRRTGGAEYGRYGYVPHSVSATLENAFADHCISAFAEELGDEANAQRFRERAQNYRKIFSPEVGWMRPKDENGNWEEWRGIYDTGGCVESNIFQQSWFVPHDPQGLISLMGRETFLKNLDRFMEESDLSAMWNEAYNHPNEPCHHLVHIFTDAGQPHKTQYWVRRIQQEAYNTTEYGFCGNEDVGQMSAWFVLTALGFHMMAPGSNIFHVNTPLFRRAEIRLDGTYHSRSVSDTLVVECDRDPKDFLYIYGIDVNGRPVRRAWLTWDEIASGGVITYHLTDTPDDAWAAQLPPSPSLPGGTPT
jgi:predicted alpha-1,2-mannosidase